MNQMRFFSSSALPSAEKLRFAASCSAAETIFGFLPRVVPSHLPPRRQIRRRDDDIISGSDRCLRHEASYDADVISGS